MGPIKKVGIIGLGALGVMYADMFTRALGKDQVLVLADAARAARYRDSGVFFNGSRCDFDYQDAAAVKGPVDLLLFAVKFGGLEDAVATCRHLVGPDTTLLSVLNGIRSEQILSAAFRPEQVVWCVAQKMSAQKQGNYATCTQTGELAIGVPAGQDAAHLRRLAAFFDLIGAAYALPADIRLHKWSKLLCNTGCNQAALVYQCGFRGLQQPGPARDTMIAAMREVVAVANAEGVGLTEQDVQDWVAVIDGLDPDFAPSMRQDGIAHRRSEVELFAGTICPLARKHGIPVPVNDRLYEDIQKMEAAY